MSGFSQKTHVFAAAALIGLSAALLIHCAMVDVAALVSEVDVGMAKAAPSAKTAKIILDRVPSKAKVDTSTAKAKNNLKYGMERYNARNYEVAEYYFKKVLFTYPDNPLALKYLAWTHFFQQRYDKALKSFQKARSIYPRDANPVLGTAWTYFGVKNYAKALETFELAEKKSGDPYEIHKGKGFSYLELLIPDKARQEFEFLFTAGEVDRVIATWREWKAKAPGALIHLVSFEAETPSLFALPIEKPRYRSGVLAYQISASLQETDPPWVLFYKGSYGKAAQQFKKSAPWKKSLDAANGLAWSYLRNGNIAKAEKLFRKILKKFPHFKGLMEGLKEVETLKRQKAVHADYYLGLKKHKIARAKYRELVKRFPDWPYPYVNLGFINLQINHTPKAQSLFQKALRLDPENPKARAGLEEVYKIEAPLLLQANQERDIGNFISASWLYQEYLKEPGKPPSSETRAEAYHGLGWSYFEKKQYLLAIPKFAEAKKYKRFKLEALKGLGFSYYQLADFQKAARYLEEADKIRPGQTDIVYKLDWSILQSADLNQAEKHFQNALEKHPLRVSSYMGLGWIHYKKGNPDLAVEYFLKAISLDPDFAWTKEFRAFLDQQRFGWQVYNRFGWAYYHRQEYPQSLKAFRISLSKDPRRSETLKGIGYILFEQKKYKEAIGFLRKTLALNANPHPVTEMVTGDRAIAPFEIQTSVRAKLGWSFFHLAKYAQAVSLFNQGLEKHPDWPDINDGLGWTYLKMNRLQESRAAFNTAIQNGPLNYSAHDGLKQVKQIIANQKLEEEESQST